MDKLSFEDAMKKLEDIVIELESGDIPLEKALERFETGIKLSRICAAKLDETEKRVSILLKDQAGNLSEKPFDLKSDD